MKDNNNFERVMAAVEELNGIRWGYVSTERILFLCEQSEPTEVSLTRDEKTNQSESNLKTTISSLLMNLGISLSTKKGRNYYFHIYLCEREENLLLSRVIYHF